MTETQEAINNDFALVGQLLPLRRLRLHGPGQRHRRPRRLRHARRRHQCAAQRLQRPAAVRPGDPRARAVLQEALPEGHDRRRHRLRRGLGQDPDGPAVRRPEDWATRSPTSTTSTRWQSDFTTDVINMRNKGVNAVDLTGIDWQDAAIFVAERQHPELAPGPHLLGRPRLRRPVHLPRRRPGGDQRDPDRPGLRPLPRRGRRARCRPSSSSTPT